jgi:hypothetical protein
MTQERVNKLDQQEQNLDQIVTLKLYSFAHYLRLINFKGYAKWLTLNQSIVEEHPEHLDLQIISQDQVMGKTGIDEVYKGLLKHYAHKFMSMTKQESNSIQSKMMEFKSL